MAANGYALLPHLPPKKEEITSMSPAVLKNFISKEYGLPLKNTLRSRKWLRSLILFRILGTSYQIQIPSWFICEATHVIHYYELYDQLAFWHTSLKFTVVNVPALTVTMKCFPMKYLFCLGITLSPLGKETHFHYCVPYSQQLSRAQS